MVKCLCALDLSANGGCVSVGLSNQLLAAACLDGTVHLYTIQQSQGKVSLTKRWTRRHKAAARRVRFSHDGRQLYCVTANRGLTVWDVQTSRKARCIRESHDDKPYSLCTCGPSGRIATGDEAGCVRLWDLQSDRPMIRSYAEQEEDVTDLCVVGGVEETHDLGSLSYGKSLLLATSQDGTLVVYDPRKRKSYMTSEMMHSELLSVCAGLGDTRTYVGAGDGHLEVFNDGSWGNITSRVKVGKSANSVDCLQKLSTCTMLASCSFSPYISVLNVHQNVSHAKFSAHEMGVEELAVDGALVASCGHDDLVKLWATEQLEALLDLPTNRSTAQATQAENANFFSDL